MGLLGIEYEGADSSIVYVAYIVSIAGLSLLSYIFATAKKGILKGEAVLIAIIIGLFSLHAIWVIFDPMNTPLFPRFLLFFLLFGLPGFLSAATAIKLNLVPNLIRISEVFVILIATGIILFSVLPSLAGIRTASLAGATYQVLSYYSAFAFGMLVAYNLNLPNYLRLKITSHTWYRLVSYALMLGCVYATFLGAGRGAFLLLLAYLIIGTASIFFNKRNMLTRYGLVNTTFKLTSIILVVSVFMALFWDDSFVQSGFNRATQFIGADGSIDLERGSSGRDVVYRVALQYIEQRSVLGYGPFGFRENTIHAHNLFLEVWLQLGVIGLILFSLAGLSLFVRAIRNRTDFSVWVFSLLLYPLVMLMFSGAYMHMSIFIFGISFVAIYSKLPMENSIKS